MSKTIRSWNADADINDTINESNITKGKLSNWVNDKIRKGILFDKQEHPKSPEPVHITRAQTSNIRVKI